MSPACSRSLFFMVFIAGSMALGVSYYLEYAVGLQPCGLCLLQRVCLAMLTGVCLLASVHGPARFGTFVYWFLGLMASLAGTVTAWRQVLLQTDPAKQFATCPTDLSELFATTPWTCVVQRLFAGAADCGRISWTLFDLSIAEWSLLFFVAITILCVYQVMRQVWIVCQRPVSAESSHPTLVGD
ncbi:disulfide bond formation protein B [Pseudomonas sp. PB3P13]